MELVLRRDDDKNEVGKRIRATREAAGLSQNDLADIMGTSSNVVYRHENGSCEMGIQSVPDYSRSHRADRSQV